MSRSVGIRQILSSLVPTWFITFRYHWIFLWLFFFFFFLSGGFTPCRNLRPSSGRVVIFVLVEKEKKMKRKKGDNIGDPPLSEKKRICEEFRRKMTNGKPAAS